MIQESVPLDRQWRKIDPSAITRAGAALIVKHPEVNSSSLTPERRIGLLYAQWKILRDKYNRDNKSSKDGLRHDLHAIVDLANERTGPESDQAPISEAETPEAEGSSR